MFALSMFSFWETISRVTIFLMENYHTKILRYKYSTTGSVYIARSISHGTDTSKKRSSDRSFHKCLDHFVLVIEQAKFVDGHNSSCIFMYLIFFDVFFSSG